jgi:hypothetical protein
LARYRAKLQVSTPPEPSITADIEHLVLGQLRGIRTTVADLKKRLSRV